MSFTSAPYAPMFCTAEAPTSPGISERFSVPCHPWSTQCATTSSHVSPLPHLTSTPPSMNVVLMPLMAECSTVPLKSFVSNRLLPPPMRSNGISVSLKLFTASFASLTEAYSMKRLHLASMPNVLCCARL